MKSEWIALMNKIYMIEVRQTEFGGNSLNWAHCTHHFSSYCLHLPPYSSLHPKVPYSLPYYSLWLLLYGFQFYYCQTPKVARILLQNPVAACKDWVKCGFTVESDLSGDGSRSARKHGRSTSIWRATFHSWQTTGFIPQWHALQVHAVLAQQFLTLYV